MYAVQNTVMFDGMHYKMFNALIHVDRNAAIIQSIMWQGGKDKVYDCMSNHILCIV